jgi:antitoxin component YwqK of YwqJK toxin-antitoxin module
MRQHRVPVTRLVVLGLVITLSRAVLCLSVSEAQAGPCPNGQKLQEFWWTSTQLRGRGCIGRNVKDLQGKWEFFHPNGRKAQESTFKDGKLHGWSTFWRHDGTKDWESKFERGGIIRGTCRAWDENGQPRSSCP